MSRNLKLFQTVVIGLVLCSGVSSAQKAALSSSDVPRVEAAARGALATPSTVLAIDVADVVIYVPDSTWDKIATVPTLTLQQPKPFVFNFGLGDIKAINGKPVKGLWMIRAATILATPQPGPTTGIAIADVERLALVDMSFDILQEDGTPIGSIMGVGPGFGPPPPGAPLATRLSNVAVAGGTGAFLGIRGQLGTTGFSPDKPPPRFASTSENPAFRRANGGGHFTFIVHMIPPQAPEVVYLLGTLPSVFHVTDVGLVTDDDPAYPGEVLSMLAKGLGPTNPGVDPNQPFPRNPLAICNSPIEVLVNGAPAQVLFAGGEPGSVDTYSIDFRLPTTTASGSAKVQIRAGFVDGPTFTIPVAK